MTVEISPELEHFVRSEISSGNYSTDQELVEHAILLLKRDREEAIHGVIAGLEDVAAGRVQPLAEAFADIRRECQVPEVE